MKKRVIIFSMIAIIAIFSLIFVQQFDSTQKNSTQDMDMNTGRSSATSSAEDAKMMIEPSKSTEMATPIEPNENVDTTSKDRKIIYSANMNLDVKDLEKTKKQINQIVQSKSAIILSQNWETQGEYKSGSLTIKVPQEDFTNLITEIGEIKDVKVLNQNLNSQDETATYIDLEARLKAHEAVAARLYELMNSAITTADVLQISKELGDTQVEIESLKSQINYINNQSAMSTVVVHLDEDPTVPKHTNNNTWEKTKQAFADSWQQILSFFSGLFIFIVGRSPILFLFLVIALISWIVYRKYLKREKFKE